MGNKGCGGIPKSVKGKNSNGQTDPQQKKPGKLLKTKKVTQKGNY